MDESLKQLISIVIVVVVGVFLIAYVNGDFGNNVTNAIDSYIESFTEEA